MLIKKSRVNVLEMIVSILGWIKKTALSFSVFIFLFPLMSFAADEPPQFEWISAIPYLEYKPPAEAFSTVAASQKERAKLDGLLAENVRLRQIALKILKAPFEYKDGTCVSRPTIPVVFLKMNPESKYFLGLDFDKGWMLVDLLDDNFPASKVLRKGDHITKLNGIPVEKLRYAKAANSVTYPEKVTIEVRRLNEIFKVELPLVPQSCDINPIVIYGAESFAWAGGQRNVVFSRGMMNFVDNDDQLAFVLGHEISHLHFYHREGYGKRTKTKNVLGVTLASASIWANLNSDSHSSDPSAAFFAGEKIGDMIHAPFLKDQEAAADAMSVSLLRAAGFDPVRGVGYFLKASMNNPKTNHYNFTHPTSDGRYRDLMASLGQLIDVEAEKTKAVEEIERKAFEAAKKKGSRADNYKILQELLMQKNVYADMDWNVMSEEEYINRKQRVKIWKSLKKLVSKKKISCVDIEDKLGKPDYSDTTDDSQTRWGYIEGHIVFDEDRRVSKMDNPNEPLSFKKGAQIYLENSIPLS